MITSIAFAACLLRQDDFRVTKGPGLVRELLEDGPYFETADPNGEVSRKLVLIFRRLVKLSTDELQTGIIDSVEDISVRDRPMFYVTLLALDEFVFDVPARNCW